VKRKARIKEQHKISAVWFPSPRRVRKRWEPLAGRRIDRKNNNTYEIKKRGRRNSSETETGAHIPWKVHLIN